MLPSSQNNASLAPIRKVLDKIKFDVIQTKFHTYIVMIDKFEIDNIADAEGMLACAYTDPEVFELEIKRIFEKVWIFVGHVSQVPNPGDFRRTRIGTNEVLLVRQQDLSLRTLFNACAHRGTRLCSESQGTRKSFVCPYHAWTFEIDGTLRGVPDISSYPNSFDVNDSSMHLNAAPRVEEYRGFIFASLAEQGPDLIHFLGKMTDAIDNLVDRSPEQSICIDGGNFRVRYFGNWKLHHENANDTVHPGFVHESSVTSARQAKNTNKSKNSSIDEGQTIGMMVSNGLTPKDWNSIELSGLPNGHSFMGGFYKSGLLAPQQNDTINRKYRKSLEKAYGKEKASKILGMDRFNNLVWPNLNINAQFHQIRVVHPISVNETVIEGYCFRLKGAPNEIFYRSVRFLGTLVSPASMIFSDDLEIFERVQHGLENGRIERLDARRGITTDKIIDETGERRSTSSSELPLRSQIAAWKHWMTSDK